MYSLNDVLRYRIGHVLAPLLSGGARIPTTMPVSAAAPIPWMTITLVLLALTLWEN